MAERHLYLYRYYTLNVEGEVETEDELIWSLEINFSRDVLAGILAIGCELIKEINANIEPGEAEFSLILDQGFGKSPLGSHRNASHFGQVEIDNLSKFDNSYVGATNENYDAIEYHDFHAPIGSFGIWGSGYDRGVTENYNLYFFQNLDEFMQGFISMANNFQVDFRDHIISLPFDSNNIEYDLPDYNLANHVNNA